MLISFHPESLFHSARAGENGVEGRGGCKSSAVVGTSREKIQASGCFSNHSRSLLCLKEGYCYFIKLKRNRH